MLLPERRLAQRGDYLDADRGAGAGDLHADDRGDRRVGSPSLSATNSFTVTVNDVNTAPVLPAQSNRTVNELALLTVNKGATDSDVPAKRFELPTVEAPAGAAIGSAGRLPGRRLKRRGLGLTR